MRRGTAGKSTNLQLLRKPEAKALLGADVAVCPCTTAGMPAGLTEDDEACFDAIKVCVCARARVLVRVREGTLQGG